MKRTFRALSIAEGGVEWPGGLLVVDDEARVIEVVRREGRVRKKEVVVVRAGFDESKPRVEGRGLAVGGALVRLSAADVGAVMGLLVGQRRSRARAEMGEASARLLEARGKALASVAEMKDRPREVLFRAREAAPGSTLESMESLQGTLAGEVGRSLEGVEELLSKGKGGLAQPGTNKAWATVYALCSIQDSALSKDEGGAGRALAFLGGAAPGDWPSPAEVASAGAKEATSELARQAFARLALEEKDWAP